MYICFFSLFIHFSGPLEWRSGKHGWLPKPQPGNRNSGVGYCTFQPVLALKLKKTSNGQHCRVFFFPFKTLCQVLIWRVLKMPWCPQTRLVFFFSFYCLGKISWKFLPPTLKGVWTQNKRSQNPSGGVYVCRCACVSVYVCMCECVCESLVPGQVQPSATFLTSICVFPVSDAVQSGPVSRPRATVLLCPHIPVHFRWLTSRWLHM